MVGDTIRSWHPWLCRTFGGKPLGAALHSGIVEKPSFGQRERAVRRRSSGKPRWRHAGYLVSLGMITHRASLLLIAACAVVSQLAEAQAVKDVYLPGLYRGLVTLRSMPDAKQITDVEIPTKDPSIPAAMVGLSSCMQPKLDEQGFRLLMTSASAISVDDPRIRNFHYAPWCRAAFATPSGRVEVELFLGGRGMLTQPNGDRGMFAYAYHVRPKQ
ncbi:MAG: hypothetical protein ABI777_08395 [Betaproteobacteria bacterium]